MLKGSWDQYLGSSKSGNYEELCKGFGFGVLGLGLGFRSWMGLGFRVPSRFRLRLLQGLCIGYRVYWF